MGAGVLADCRVQDVEVVRQDLVFVIALCPRFVVRNHGVDLPLHLLLPHSTRTYLAKQAIRCLSE